MFTSSLADIARNFRERIINGLVKKIHYSSPPVGQAIEVLEAFKLAKDMDSQDIIVESYLTILILAIVDHQSSKPWVIHATLQTILSLILIGMLTELQIVRPS